MAGDLGDGIGGFGGKRGGGSRKGKMLILPKYNIGSA
jgi:hypothetical protein